MAAYEFWAQRDGADYLKLSVPSDSTPTIDWTADAQIKASAALQCVYDARISWLTDDLAIYRDADGVRECLGVFCVTTSPISTDESGVQIQSLTGYDQTYVLVELSRLEYTHTVRAGTGYMDAIREQLIAAGIHQMMLTDCPDRVATDMAWEPGTSRYDIISQLLSDINYRDLWFNGSGCAICEPWAPAAITPATHTYDASAASGMLVEMDQDCDTFSAANVFVSIVSSADIAGEMRAESVNDDISSPLSVQRRGRRIRLTLVVVVRAVREMGEAVAADEHADRAALISGPRRLVGVPRVRHDEVMRDGGPGNRRPDELIVQRPALVRLVGESDRLDGVEARVGRQGQLVDAIGRVAETVRPVLRLRTDKRPLDGERHDAGGVEQAGVDIHASADGNAERVVLVPELRPVTMADARDGPERGRIRQRG